jgi:hypothetical protein
MKERFKVIYKQGTMAPIKLIVDTETGVTYMFHAWCNSGGMSVLLDKDGKPVITSPSEYGN